MKTFQEWLSLKENMTTGQSPVATGRQMTPSIPYLKKPNPAAAGLWKANGPLTRLSYLHSIPNAEQLGLHKMNWEDLPPEAQHKMIGVSSCLISSILSAKSYTGMFMAPLACASPNSIVCFRQSSN